MRVSAAEAIGPAFSRMARICFKPFNIGKWFVMGFCAFLSTCGETGYQFNSNYSGGSGSSSSSGPSLQDVKDYIAANLGWLIVVAALAVVVVLAIAALAMWLRCRGRLMFLENIAANRAAVVEPWKRFARQAMSYFWFTVLIAVLGTIALFLFSGLALLIALPDIRAEEFGGPAIAAIVVGGLLVLASSFTFAMIQIFAYDFVVPIMIIRDVKFWPAWREAKINVVRGHIGQLIIFYLLKIVFGIGAATIGFLAICLTCCIGALPYLSSVLLLPLLVFNRAFALCFLEQFHPDYNLMSDLPPFSPGFPVELNAPPNFPPPPPSPFA